MQARYSSILILLTLFLSLPFLVLADNAFCGCQQSLTSNYIAASPAVNYTSGTQCQQACYNMRNPTPAVAGRTNYRHSMFRRTDGTCYCTDKYPSAAYQSNGQPETCANPADWDNRIVQTTFIKYPDCYATLPANIVMSSIAGPDSCSVKCASSINFVFYMDPASNSFTCGCGTIGATLPATAPTCGPNTYFIYYHTVAQASQGLSRRSRLAQALAKSRKSELCPKGLTACRVNNGSELFECVDTESDVDSCGGCLYGSPGEPVKATGTDCYARGTALSSATCVKGKCMVQKCKKNYDLVQGVCVRRSST